MDDAKIKIALNILHELKAGKQIKVHNAREEMNRNREEVEKLEEVIEMIQKS